MSKPHPKTIAKRKAREQAKLNVMSRDMAYVEELHRQWERLYELRSHYSAEDGDRAMCNILMEHNTLLLKNPPLSQLALWAAGNEPIQL